MSLPSSLTRFRRAAIQASSLQDYLTLDASIDAEQWPMSLKRACHEEIGSDLAPIIYRAMYELSEEGRLPESSDFYNFHLKFADDLFFAFGENEATEDDAAEDDIDPDADSEEMFGPITPVDCDAFTVKYMQENKSAVLLGIFSAVYPDDPSFVFTAYNTPDAELSTIIQKEVTAASPMVPYETDVFDLKELLAVPHVKSRLFLIEDRIANPARHLSFQASELCINYYRSIITTRDPENMEAIADALHAEEDLSMLEGEFLDDQFQVHLYVIAACARYEAARERLIEARSLGITTSDLYIADSMMTNSTTPDLLSSIAAAVHQCRPAIDQAMLKPFDADEFMALVRHIRSSIQEHFSSAMVITDMMSSP